MKPTTKLLTVKNLSQTYGKKKIFDDVNFELEQGKWLGIVGKNGCGKSTLVKTLIGLKQREAGEIFLLGKNINDYSSKSLFTNIQLISQYTRNALDPLKTVRSILSEPLILLKGYSKAACQPIVEQVLSKCNLSSNLLDLKPQQLSGGQYQRICILRALIIEPQLLICDEATASLDAINQLRIIQLLKTYSSMSVILISHNRDLIAKTTDTILLLDENPTYITKGAKS